MPELLEQMYCSQQIVIPPKFPYVLKRYAKAAIKTQPYDLLRWSFEYFRALSEHRPPPVKLRLEYPVFSTEGGLTRGYLRVLAMQRQGMSEVPLKQLSLVWAGACLDPCELTRILCLCEVYKREVAVPRLHFVAVAAGLLTKTLTHTMTLLCETLTAEPDGGSAAISLQDFLLMYRLLAAIDASAEVKYYDGFREGWSPEEEVEEEGEGEEEITESDESITSEISDTYDTDPVQRITLIDDYMRASTRLSIKLNQPLHGKLSRSPSVERAGQLDRDAILRERKDRAEHDDDIDEKLRELSGAAVVDKEEKREVEKVIEDVTERVEIHVYNEDDVEVSFQLYGEPPEEEIGGEEETAAEGKSVAEEEMREEMKGEEEILDKIQQYVADAYKARADRLRDLERTFEELADIVDRYNTVNYDLGMVAGRQMSTTSGEFIVQSVEKDIMDYVNEQIAILPDPDLKKKKAKPEEVEMIKQLLQQFLDDNMETICPELEQVEEEEAAVPDIITVYAVPGIGPPVDLETVAQFVTYATDVAARQAGLFMPRNIRHFLCPPLEKFVEHDYPPAPAQPAREEVPTGGLMIE